MPITPDHEWEESPEDVVVTVRPKGVAADKVDVYATAAFLKVNRTLRRPCHVVRSDPPSPRCTGSILQPMQ